MHTNHRRAVPARQNYRYDNRSWKVRGFRCFRRWEVRVLRRVIAGADPDNTVFPTDICDNDNRWFYDD